MTDLETRMALQNGADAMKQMRETLERAVQELQRYETRYHTAEGLLDKAQAINWALTHLCTAIMPNARIDLAASAQAELHVLAAKAKQPGVAA